MRRRRERVVRRASLLGAMVVTLASSASAQDEDNGTAKLGSIALFLERSYFSPATPSGKNLVFEGQATGHYFIHNTLTDAVWQKDGGWKFVTPITMSFIVRMSTDRSNPVRTPAYKIRPFYLQSIHLRRDTIDLDRFRLFEVGVGVTHYSNGQAGCTYQGFTPAADASKDECDVTNPALAARRLTNTIDGDFSTTFVPIAVHYRLGHLSKPLSPVDHQLTLGAELQIHPLENWAPGAMNGAQAAQYGQHQYSLNVELERRYFTKHLPGVGRVGADYTERFGGGAPRHLRAETLEASYVLDRVEHLGAFVRGHWGYDYYNIQWQSTKPFVAFGFMWDLGRLDVLNTDTTR